MIARNAPEGKMFKGTLVVGAIVGSFLATIGWLFWILIGRPYAVSRGMIPMAAYDYVVRGWKAERQGKWAEALVAYDKALDVDPRHQDAHERRAALLDAHPELVDPRKSARAD